jgi:hypothetical protein
MVQVLLHLYHTSCSTITMVQCCKNLMNTYCVPVHFNVTVLHTKDTVPYTIAKLNCKKSY